MVQGQHLLEAVWARDKSTLWNALKRLIVPLYLQSPKTTIGIWFALLFLLFIPFPVLAYSAIFVNISDSFLALFTISVITVIFWYIAIILQTEKGLEIDLKYAVLGPVGSFIILLGFGSGILKARSESAVKWRGRNYSMKNQIQNSINV